MRQTHDENIEVECPNCGVDIIVPYHIEIKPIKKGCEDLWASIDMIIMSLELENHTDRLDLINYLKSFRRMLEQ